MSNMLAHTKRANKAESEREREERGVSAFRLSFIAVSLFRNKKGLCETES